MADRFYTPDPLGPGEYILVGAEAHHLAAVRRLGPGQSVVLFNGDGHEYPAEILTTGKRAIVLNILRVQAADRERPFPLVVAAALPKGDRADFLLEKLIELGVTRFVPLVTARSVVHPKESVVAKFTRAVIEASKQCGRNRLMTIDPPQRWQTFVGRGDLPNARFLLHTAVGASALPRVVGPVAVAVGPEGGFTPEEVEQGLAAGWQVASLGPRTLRVETAAVAAAAILASPSEPEA